MVSLLRLGQGLVDLVIIGILLLLLLVIIGFHLLFSCYLHIPIMVSLLGLGRGLVDLVIIGKLLLL